MAYEGPEIQGWMKPHELEWLYETARAMESIVEVGSWKGLSTHALLSGAHPRPVFAVDHFRGNRAERQTIHKEANETDIGAEFQSNVGHFKNLSLLRMSSRDASRFFATRSVDMVFLDGGHEKDEVVEDILLWQPIARKMLCGHDITHKGVEDALLELNLTYEITAGSIWRLN